MVGDFVEDFVEECGDGWVRDTELLWAELPLLPRLRELRP